MGRGRHLRHGGPVTTGHAHALLRLGRTSWWTRHLVLLTWTLAGVSRRHAMLVRSHGSSTRSHARVTLRRALARMTRRHTMLVGSHRPLTRSHTRHSSSHWHSDIIH